jgi:SpoVK/Ycf46/Vps4 family AAA+-type ATPase
MLMNMSGMNSNDLDKLLDSLKDVNNILVDIYPSIKENTKDISQKRRHLKNVQLSSVIYEIEKQKKKEQKQPQNIQDMFSIMFQQPDNLKEIVNPLQLISSLYSQLGPQYNFLSESLDKLEHIVKNIGFESSFEEFDYEELLEPIDKFSTHASMQEKIQNRNKLTNIMRTLEKRAEKGDLRTLKQVETFYNKLTNNYAFRQSKTDPSEKFPIMNPRELDLFTQKVFGENMKRIPNLTNEMSTIINTSNNILTKISNFKNLANESLESTENVYSIMAEEYLGRSTNFMISNPFITNVSKVIHDEFPGKSEIEKGATPKQVTPYNVEKGARLLESLASEGIYDILIHPESLTKTIQEHLLELHNTYQKLNSVIFKLADSVSHIENDNTFSVKSNIEDKLLDAEELISQIGLMNFGDIKPKLKVDKKNDYFSKYTKKNWKIIEKDYPKSSIEDLNNKTGIPKRYIELHIKKLENGELKANENKLHPNMIKYEKIIKSLGSINSEIKNKSNNIHKLAKDETFDLLKMFRRHRVHKNKKPLEEIIDNPTYFITEQNSEGVINVKPAKKPNVKFSEIFGESYDEVKDHLKTIELYSKYPSLYAATSPSKSIKGNILLIGPPGCGKTELVKALASKNIVLDTRFSDIRSKWYGSSEKNVDILAEKAQEIAKETGKPTYVFIDEIDGILATPNANSSVSDVDTNLVKIFQEIMDGTRRYEGVIWCGATNNPERLSPAVLRRFDYVDVVGQLTQQERSNMLQNYVTLGLPTSRDLTKSKYMEYASILEGATGDTVRKVADVIHEKLMSKLIHDNPKAARSLESTLSKGGFDVNDLTKGDRRKLKKDLAQYIQVDAEMLRENVINVAKNPAIQEEIKEATRVYAQANALKQQFKDKVNTSDNLYA